MRCGHTPALHYKARTHSEHQTQADLIDSEYQSSKSFFSSSSLRLGTLSTAVTPKAAVSMLGHAYAGQRMAVC